MSSIITILEATAIDAPVIREIAESTWWRAYGDILPKDQIRYMLHTLYAESAVREQLEQGSQKYLLVKQGGSVVGFASFAPREENRDIVKLHKLYCLPEVQQKGYGRMLVEEVERRGKEAGRQAIELNVNRHNPAKAFYEKLGFSVAYEEDIPIGTFWMNDYVMTKRI